MYRLLLILGLIAACAPPGDSGLIQIGGDVYAQSPGGLVKIFVDGTSIAGAGTHGDPLRSIVTMSAGVFGDGTDGPCVFDGTTTVAGVAPLAAGTIGLQPPYDAFAFYILTSDLFCSTVAVSTAVVVDTDGFRLFGSTSFVSNGNALVGTPGCTGWAGDGSPAGAGGCGPAAGVVPGQASFGGNGLAGTGASPSNGAAGTPRGWPGTSIASAGHGGAGNALGGAVSGGSALTTAQGDVHTLDSALRARTPTGTAIGNIFPSGAGGGGDNAGHLGGGGGGAAGWTVVASPTITTNGTSAIVAPGGAGGAGSTGFKTGGGGGGWGGVVVIVYSGTAPRTNVAGGAGGAGKSGGTDGTVGNDGLVLSWKIGVQ